MKPTSMFLACLLVFLLGKNTLVYADDEFYVTAYSSIEMMPIPPTTATIRASIFTAQPHNDDYIYRWDTDGDGVFDDAEGKYISYSHDFGTTDLTYLINLFNSGEFGTFWVKVFLDGKEMGIGSNGLSNKCRYFPLPYLNRYNKCMEETDSKDKNYCRAQMGCVGSIGPFNVEDDTGIFYPTYNR